MSIREYGGVTTYFKFEIIIFFIRYTTHAHVTCARAHAGWQSQSMETLGAIMGHMPVISPGGSMAQFSSLPRSHGIGGVMGIPGQTGDRNN